MSATFGSLISRIADKLIVDDMDSQIGVAINSAIDFYKVNRLWFNETSTTLTLTIGNPALTLPSDFLYEIDQGGLVLDYNDSRYELTKISPGEYDALNNEGTGQPFCYTARRGQVEVYWYPDQAYSLVLRYVKRYSDLVNSSDSNDWTIEADRLIEAKALSDIYLDFRHEPEMAVIYAQKAQAELEKLIDITTEKLTTGLLITENIIDLGE